MTDTEIERIEALMREATPGPWGVRGAGLIYGNVPRPHSDVVLYDTDAGENDLSLIVAAVNALPALLAERKELLRRVEEAEQCLGDAAREIPEIAGPVDRRIRKMRDSFVSEREALRAQLAEAHEPFCDQTGERAKRGECPIHRGDACLVMPAGAAKRLAEAQAARKPQPE